MDWGNKVKSEQTCDTCKNRQCKCIHYYECQVAGTESYYECDEKALKALQEIRQEMKHTSSYALKNGYI